MLDLVSTFQSIIGLGFKINDVLATFRTNQEGCRKIRLLVETTQAVVEPLKQAPPTVLGNRGMSAALRGLEEALGRSVEVVNTCQKKCAIRGCIDANSIARDLDRVYNDISINLVMVILANSVDVRLMLMGIVEALPDLSTSGEADHPYAHLQQQVEKSLQTHRSSTKVPADSSGSRASLSYEESTSVKSVDGQGHPRIATKVISSSTGCMTGMICIDLHPTKPWIVTGDKGGNVCIWDYLKEETVMKKLVTKKPSGFANFMHECSQYYKEEAGKHWVCSVKFITEKNWLVVGDGKGYIHVYDYTNTELHVVKEFKVHDGKSVDLAIHPTKRYLLLSSSAYGNKIILWDWSSDEWKNKHEFDVKSTYPKGVLSLKCNPRDSNTFACVTDDERLMVGNIKSYSLATKEKGISKADYFFNRTDQHLMVTLSFSSQDAEIWDLKTGKIVASLGVSGRITKLVAGHPTLPILITTLDDGTVCFWDASTYRLEGTVHITDEPADDLTLVTDVNDITRLAVTSKSTTSIMEVSYSPMAITSR